MRRQLGSFREITKFFLNQSIDTNLYCHLYLLVLACSMFLMRNVVRISTSLWPNIKKSTLLYDHIYLKWWDPHTNKIKYFPSSKFDKYNNKVGQGWSPGSEIMLGTNMSTLPKLKLTSRVILSSKMIYLKSMLIYHKEVLL